MADALIENPILNGPFEEPTRYWSFTDEGISSDWVEGRRSSAYFMPIARSKRSSQLEMETEWTADRIEENVFINEIRDRVGDWRQEGHPGITETPAAFSVWDSRRPREKAPLLPGRGGRDGDLPLRDRRPHCTSGRSARQRVATASGRCKPWPVSDRLQDGHWDRKDRGNGDVHRLADPESRSGAARPPFQRCLPCSGARNHDS